MDLFDDKPTRGKKFKQNRNRSSSSSGGSGGKQHNELVLKVVSNIKGNNSDNSIDYITRNNENKHDKKEYISPENEMGDKLKKEELEQLKSEWKEEFSDPSKIKTRNMTHIVLSVDIDDTEKNRRNLQNATRDFLAERFGDEGFRYIYVQHNDTEKPHVHIMVNNNNLETGKKLRIDMDWHYESRLMAKEHLKNHGINQEATFKKDRQIIQEKEKHFLDQDRQVTNWFDAKLKQAASNDIHFTHLKRQFDVVQTLKADMKQSDRFSTQQQVELSKRVKELREGVTLYDNFSSRTEANAAVSKMIKDIAPKESITQQVKNALGQNADRQATEEKKHQRQLYFHAKALVRAEAIVESTQSSSKEKRLTMSAIKERKAFLSSQGIDIKKLEQDYRVELSDNDKFKLAYRSLNKFVQLTDKRIKEKGMLEQGDTEKRLSRALETLHSASKTALSKDEDKTLETLRAKTLIELESRGFPAKQHFKEWEQSRTFKDEVAKVKTTFQKTELGSDKVQLDKVQSNIIKLQNQLSSDRPKQLGKKEGYSAAVSLKNAQQKLDQITGYDHAEHVKKSQFLAKGFKSYDEKQQSSNQRDAKRQAFAMSSSYLALAQAAQKAPLPSQQVQNNKDLATLRKQFEARGIDLEKNTRTLQRNDEIKVQIKEFGETSMKRVRATGYDRTEKAAEQLKQDLNSSSLSQSVKRELNTTLREKNNEISNNKVADSKQLHDNMKKLKALDEQVKAMTKPEQTKGLSALERLTQQRSVSSVQKEIAGLVKDSRKLIGAVDTKERVSINRTISNLERDHVSQAQDRGR